MTSRGIDYSNGTANFNPETGIHFGVVPMNSLASWAWDSFEADFGDPHCPKCGNEACDSSGDDVPDFDEPENEDIEVQGCGDYYCESCRYAFDGDEAFSDEASGHTLDDGEYKAVVGSDGVDAFVLLSPYYTKSQFCSPCAPGAGYMLNPVDDGVKTYCFNHDWFDDQPCSYPIWRVDNDSLVYDPKGATP